MTRTIETPEGRDARVAFGVGFFGDHLKARRKELGFSLRDVEKITNGQVSNAYLSQLENNQIKNPSFMIVIALAAAYHVQVDTLIDWINSPVAGPTLCPTCGRPMFEEAHP